MNQPSEAEIVEALKQSGYLFEQDVATLLANLDFHVETSWAYLDVDSEKSREVDVRAIKQVAYNESHKLQVFVELLVECKDFGSPIVFLERLKNERELKHPVPEGYIFPLSYYKQQIDVKSYREVAPFSHLGLQAKHYYFREEKKATQFAKIVQNHKGGKDWVANHDGIYDALILPQAKLLEFRKKELLKLARGNWKAVWLLFSVVVLRDHLFVYDLSGQKRTLQNRGRVSFVRHLESRNLKGYYLTDFVTYEYVTKYVTEEIAGFSGYISGLAEKEPKVLLNNA